MNFSRHSKYTFCVWTEETVEGGVGAGGAEVGAGAEAVIAVVKELKKLPDGCVVWALDQVILIFSK